MPEKQIIKVSQEVQNEIIKTDEKFRELESQFIQVSNSIVELTLRQKELYLTKTENLNAQRKLLKDFYDTLNVDETKYKVSFEPVKFEFILEEK